MDSLGNILKHHASQIPVLKKAEASLVVDTANEVLKNIIGSVVIKYARALYCKQGVLAITCLSPVMAQEIRLNEAKIISAINSKLSQLAVNKIRYLNGLTQSDP